MRVLVNTDEPVLAEGFRCVLASAGVEIVDEGPGATPEVILLAFHAGIQHETVAELRRKYPSAQIVLSVERISLEVAYQAMESGVRGIVSKTLDPGLLVDALKRVAAGEIYFQCPATASVFHKQKRVLLTARECELIRLVGRGLKNKEIATAMIITEGSVKTYMSRLFRRLGTRNRFDLARYSRENLDTTAASTHDSTGPLQFDSNNSYQHV